MHEKAGKLPWFFGFLVLLKQDQWQQIFSLTVHFLRVKVSILDGSERSCFVHEYNPVDCALEMLLELAEIKKDLIQKTAATA